MSEKLERWLPRAQFPALVGALAAFVGVVANIGSDAGLLWIIIGLLWLILMRLTPEEDE